MERYPDYTKVVGFVTGESPTGSVSGLNTNYTLAHTPISGSMSCYIAGLRFTTLALSGAVVTILTALVTGTVLFDYAY